MDLPPPPHRSDRAVARGLADPQAIAVLLDDSTTEGVLMTRVIPMVVVAAAVTAGLWLTWVAVALLVTR